MSWSQMGDPACSIPFGPSQGLQMDYLPIDGPLRAFSVRVSNVTEGQTGTFPARVDLYLRTGGHYQTPETCSVEIEEHVLDPDLPHDGFGKPYLARGKGRCPDPAVEQGGGGATVEVAPFTFRFPPRW